MGKKNALYNLVISILQIFVFRLLWLWRFSPSICMNFHSGANAGATTLTLARFFLTKVIFVFLYLNICYLNYMLVYRLRIHQQEYLYYGEDIQNETRLQRWESKIFYFFFLVDWSHSISDVAHFLKTNWMCLGFFAHINVKLLLRNRILWLELRWWIC